LNDIIKEIIESIKGLNVRTDNGRIRVREYTEGEKALGHASTLQEALMKLKGNHWLDEEWEEMPPFGFIYKIVDTREKRGYIGRKQLLYYDKSVEDYTIPSAWEEYIGSCGPLKNAYEQRPEDFVFYRILNCHNRDEMGYAEHYLIRSIFDNQLVTGELEYYNNVIPKLFRGQMDGVTREFKQLVKETGENL